MINCELYHLVDSIVLSMVLLNNLCFDLRYSYDFDMSGIFLHSVIEVTIVLLLIFHCDNPVFALKILFSQQIKVLYFGLSFSPRLIMHNV